MVKTQPTPVKRLNAVQEADYVVVLKDRARNHVDYNITKKGIQIDDRRSAIEDEYKKHLRSFFVQQSKPELTKVLRVLKQRKKRASEEGEMVLESSLGAQIQQLESNGQFCAQFVEMKMIQYPYYKKNSDGTHESLDCNSSIPTKMKAPPKKRNRLEESASPTRRQTKVTRTSTRSSPVHPSYTALPGRPLYDDPESVPLEDSKPSPLVGVHQIPGSPITPHQFAMPSNITGCTPEQYMQILQAQNKKMELSIQDKEISVQEKALSVREKEIGMLQQCATMGARNSEAGLKNAEAGRKHAEAHLEHAEAGRKYAEAQLKNAEAIAKNADNLTTLMRQRDEYNNNVNTAGGKEQRHQGSRPVFKLQNWSFGDQSESTSLMNQFLDYVQFEARGDDNQAKDVTIRFLSFFFGFGERTDSSFLHDYPRRDELLDLLNRFGWLKGQEPASFIKSYIEKFQVGDRVSYRRLDRSETVDCVTAKIISKDNDCTGLGNFTIRIDIDGVDRDTDAGRIIPLPSIDAFLSASRST